MKISTLKPSVPLLNTGPANTLTAAPFSDARHGSRASRGYGPEWDRLRQTIIARDKGLCQADLKAGRYIQGSHVDHIIPKARWRILHGTLKGCDHPSNLQLLCRPCHEAKTQAEQAERFT